MEELIGLDHFGLLKPRGLHPRALLLGTASGIGNLLDQSCDDASVETMNFAGFFVILRDPDTTPRRNEFEFVLLAKDGIVVLGDRPGRLQQVTQEGLHLILSV